MPARDAALATELTQIAAAHPRYGHRFAWGILTQQRQWREPEAGAARVTGAGAVRDAAQAAEDPHRPGAGPDADGTEPGLGV